MALFLILFKIENYFGLSDMKQIAVLVMVLLMRRDTMKKDIKERIYWRFQRVNRDQHGRGAGSHSAGEVAGSLHLKPSTAERE